MTTTPAERITLDSIGITSVPAKKVVRISSFGFLGFLGGLGFLGFVPGYERSFGLFGLTGFFGFFGLIGPAYLIESVYREN